MIIRKELKNRVTTLSYNNDIDYQEMWNVVSKQNINSNLESGGMVYFGYNHNIPKLLNYYYSKSPIHSCCIDFKCRTIYGKGFNIERIGIPDLKREPIFQLLNQFMGNNIDLILKYYFIHERIYVKLLFSPEGNLLNTVLVNPDRVAHSSEVDSFTEEFKYVYFNETIQESLSDNWKKYPIYSPSSKERIQFLVFNMKSPTNNWYSVPSYISAREWIDLSTQIQLYYRVFLNNSVNPSMFMMYINGLSDDEKNALKRTINANKGAINNGNMVLIEGNGTEDSLPKFEAPPVPNNDKLFQTTSKEMREDIYTTHFVNPVLTGYDPGSGGWGEGNKLKVAYQLFDFNIGNNATNNLVNFIQKLYLVANISINFSFIKNELIIDGVVKMSENEEDGNIVDDGFNDIIKVNDNLKNMSGKQQQQLLRIIKQFTSEKINKQQAVVLLRNGFGLDDEDIEKMLAI